MSLDTYLDVLLAVVVLRFATKSKSQHKKYIACIVTSPTNAERSGGLSHSGLSVQGLRYSVLFKATRGRTNENTIVANCAAVAVVPAQCQRRPSHQNVGAIFQPILLAG